MISPSTIGEFSPPPAVFWIVSNYRIIQMAMGCFFITWPSIWINMGLHTQLMAHFVVVCSAILFLELQAMICARRALHNIWMAFKFNTFAFLLENLLTFFVTHPPHSTIDGGANLGDESPPKVQSPCWTKFEDYEIQIFVPLFFHLKAMCHWLEQFQ